MEVIDSILGKQTTCIHCKYSWPTKSNKLFVSCPNCMNKVKVGR